MVSADNVASLRQSQIALSLPASAIDGLSTYAEEATYHLASVGWLRNHLGWKQGSKSDEEPG